MTDARAEFPANAYEAIPTDEVDGRIVTGINDPDRPADSLGPPIGPGTVTITYDDGDPDALDRMSEVTVRRLTSKLGGG
ncbi:hypothetical protein [Blastococcus sp. CT_GayMR16]|uniref:hypothetical protein n=1 Tax=Blastococcus sp. CT_GayMR16 TaxID=2559607 RepID=UPI00107336EE|nr:hypothetical protein [Blastococcus sp. CT_GayMR16]TFV83168.1 hypothetical protein E4P38_21160 [Blastococcus sp. CT_GayMR16]